MRFLYISLFLAVLSGFSCGVSKNPDVYVKKATRQMKKAVESQEAIVEGINNEINRLLSENQALNEQEKENNKGGV